jgi:LUD domain
MPEGVRAEPNPEFSRLASDEQIATTVAALNAHGLATIVVSTGAEAKDKVLEMLPVGAEVFTSLSRTLEVTGLDAAINESGRYDAIRPKLAKFDRKTQRREMKKAAAAPDFVVGSVHAITANGELLAASGSGSQLGHFAYEAAKVIWVAGTQKLVADIAEGLRRIEEYALPLENRRMVEKFGFPSLLAKILIMRREPNEGRATLVLVKENIGF